MRLSQKIIEKSIPRRLQTDEITDMEDAVNICKLDYPGNLYRHAPCVCPLIGCSALRSTISRKRAFLSNPPPTPRLSRRTQSPLLSLLDAREVNQKMSGREMGKDCSSKKRYTNWSAAAVDADSLMDRRALTFAPICPYWCENHGCFHIGHNSWLTGAKAKAYSEGAWQRTRLRRGIDLRPVP